MQGLLALLELQHAGVLSPNRDLIYISVVFTCCAVSDYEHITLSHQ